MSRYTIEGETLTGIADAIREMRHEKDELTPAQMEAKIRATKLGIPVSISIHTDPDTGKWVRPAEYPDLDVLAEQIGDDEECVYMTYDLRKIPDNPWIGIYGRCSSSGKTIHFERGHIENGAFVVDEAHPVSNITYTYFRQPLDSTNGDIQIWRMRSTDHITRYGFCTDLSTSAKSRYNMYQPCVERVGNLPYLTTLHPDSNGPTYNANYVSYTTLWLERDALVVGNLSVVTDISYAWAYSYSLQEIDFSKWTNTENWRPTTLQAIFSYCMSLRSVDLSGWEVANWKISTIREAFSYCICLKELDLSSWATASWKVTSLYYTWLYCINIEKLNVSGWDTSNWAVTSLTSAWSSCYSLKQLDLSGWNTSNWAVTSLSNTWAYCYSLASLNVSGWNTSNWAVTTLANLFYYDMNIQNLDLNNWDTSGWAVTTMNGSFYYCVSLKTLGISEWNTINWIVNNFSSVFIGCYSLKYIDIGAWNTSNWEVTILNSAFQDCRSLKSLDLSRWDTSNWVVTNLNSFCSGCYSLESVDVSTWDTSNWAVTSIQSLFSAWYSLEHLNINTWDTSNWTITSFYYLVANCRNLRSFDISAWDTSKFAVTDTRSIVSDTFNLESLKLPSGNWAVNSTNVNAAPTNSRMIRSVSGLKVFTNHSYANCFLLTPDSLAQILIDLPTVTAARTITLGVNNRNKLTAEQIAVATQKGWTVAA